MHTKRKYRIKYGILMLMLLGVCLLNGGREVRADINSAESRVIGAASSTFYYNGTYYRAKDTYINQLVNALNTQYDLTESQANVCIDYIYNNVGAAINSGYMYEVSMEEDLGNDVAPDDKPAEPGTAGGTEIAQATDKPSVITVEAPIKTKEEILKEATELASDMGVSIRFDNSEEGITITDQKGNVLISTREAVKNTGFRLNSLVIFAVGMLVAVCAAIVAAWKGKLLERDYGEEDAETYTENT